MTIGRHLSLLIVLILLLLLLVVSCSPSPTSDKFEENIEVRFSELLDSFGLLDEEKAVIDEIRSILIDPDIGSERDYKTYTDYDFYGLLNDLGADRTKEMVANYLDHKEFREECCEEIKVVIDTVEDLALREELQAQLDAIEHDYKLRFKLLLSKSDLNYVCQGVGYGPYTARFININKIAKGIIRFEELYKNLTDVQKDAIIDIQKSGVGHSDLNFRFLLSWLNVAQLKDIITFHLNVLKEREAARVALENAPDVMAKRDLQTQFNDSDRGYELHLKWCFDGFEPYEAYNRVMKSTYVKRFTWIKNGALRLALTETRIFDAPYM
ncbi:hypothetical protein bcCo53_001231 (plasmid) [Borrelia coriaceae]|uniref:Uncharacterized protein n=1 Tax=Borrelia coriaceae ATCC 43381 TaxID=1408429 RepID=W5SVZ3_9SPIR|nr:hypothetical protein [Borrelia coriaceae]AHH11057.1 hypothetical protein BCO_0005800 [Borrelia coriaceae ATCC 43381]UPA17062.1 hypothetical protein bcCo53_001231 [Borrelia coriaceae]